MDYNRGHMGLHSPYITALVCQFTPLDYNVQDSESVETDLWVVSVMKSPYHDLNVFADRQPWHSGCAMDFPSTGQVNDSAFGA